MFSKDVDLLVFACKYEIIIIHLPTVAMHSEIEGAKCNVALKLTQEL